VSPAIDRADRPVGADPLIVSAIARACERVAPLWPLTHFVAVNPFLGYAGETFAATCATLRRVARVDALMPRAFYRQLLADGRIDDADLGVALARAPRRAGAPVSVAELRLAAGRDPHDTRRHHRVVATASDVLDALAAGDRQLSRTAFMIDEISRWCAAYFDDGQAAWRLPTRHLGPYAAWRAAARVDRTPEALGIRGFRATIAGLPADPVATIAEVVAALGFPECAIEDYLHRALHDIQGWAAHARYRARDSARHGRSDETLVELLAIRIAWGYALYHERTDDAFRAAWSAAMADAAERPRADRSDEDPELGVELLLQEAYEAAYQRRLFASLARSATAEPATTPARPPLQAAFCIDVRSEVFRRALERACPAVGTIGVAGFFGAAIEYVPIGRTTGAAQCPVLVEPAYVVCEAVAGASDAEVAEIVGLRLVRRRVAKAWKAFKLSAVSSFTYVETAGLLYAGRLLGDTLGLTRAVPDPRGDGLPHDVTTRLEPRLAPAVGGDRPTGIGAEQRLAVAESLLRAMSLTRDFARLVLLVGHGSASVNNPYASGLDCGACGGHPGESNARVAAAILNDPDVRRGLEGRGIRIPDDTWFAGALHDTTTDDVHVFDLPSPPDSHREDLARARGWLRTAGSLARVERSAVLGLSGPRRIERQIRARSRDWSQVRPEWGLAGNAAFIAAPRERTRGVDLGGRVFLQSYDWRSDADFALLEQIMTAPLVVASWINLQYYGSTVNNPAFGSGNKTLHNVVGQFGVFEGNAGDLRVGLPWQSVHDGARYIHEPLRLSAIIEAPVEAIDGVIARHDGVRELVENRWIHLFALGDAGRLIHGYRGARRWEDVTRA